MRTTDRARAPRAARGPATGRRSAGRPAPDPFGPLSEDSVRDLQASAGNRATTDVVQRLTVQRALSGEQAEAIARRLEDAMSGWGTDEEAIYGALAGRTAQDMQAIREAYARLFREDLDEELADELTESELAHVRQMMAPVADESRLSAGQQAAARVDRARVIAQQLVEAMQGLGTEEDQIFNALEGRSPDEIASIQAQYRSLTGRMLETDLRDELSGSELRRAYDLLGVSTSGEFRNEIEQAMTEGYTTVVQGRFEWAIRNFQLEAEAPVKFQPDAGVTPPYSEWDTQIDATWNRFTVAEPGGRQVPIKLSLRNDPGCDRVVRVHPNTNAERWWEDRADAGNWYTRMKPSTAPHEFGHYIGLPDEYQRTHGDITAITGAAPAAGVANTSGRTPEQIAADLHAALTLEDATQRAPQATSVLRTVGLIDTNGVPQQGDFAQSVKRAHDEAFSPDLVRTMADNLPRGQKWTIQTVFSYATRTIMGNPEALSAGGVANQPHDHAVEPRHLREFAAIVRRVWPAFSWSVRSR